MSLEAFMRWIQVRPFQPFRVILSNGSTYDILHPDLVLPGRTFVMIGLPDNPNEAIAASSAMVSLIHIAEIVPLRPGLVA